MQSFVLRAVLIALSPNAFVVADGAVDREIPAKILKQLGGSGESTAQLAARDGEASDAALQRYLRGLPEVRAVWDRHAHAETGAFGMPPAEKCDFECAAAGVSTYLGCAGVCAKTLNYTAAVFCVTDGCPVVVAAATEACLQKNPLCHKAAAEGSIADLSPEDRVRGSDLEVTSTPTCTSSDMDIWKKKGHDGFEKDMTACGKKCLGAKACVSECIKQAEAYSPGCSDCFGELGQCTRDHCMLKCLNGESESCKTCTKQNCVQPFKDCSGFDDVPDASLADYSGAAETTALAAFEEKLRDGASNSNKCVLGCTLGAIGVYWGCALGCVYELAATQCITVACPAVVAASDTACLKHCKHDDEVPSAVAVQYV
jgi:hypothetical protein